MNHSLEIAASLLLASVCAAQAAPPSQPKPEPSIAIAQDSATPRVIMGILMEEVDEALAQQLGVDQSAVVLIDSVMPEYGAAKAGIKKHDVIKAIDGSSPVSSDVVRKVLAKKKEGDRVKVTYIRGRDTKTVDVELMVAKDDIMAIAGGNVAQAPQVTGTARAPEQQARVSTVTPPRAGADPAGGQVATTWLWRAQDEEMLRSAVQRLREQLRNSEQDVSRRTRDMAKESVALAEKLVQMTRDKGAALSDEKSIKRLTDAAQELADKSREKLEVELRDVLEKHRDALDKSMRDLEKLLGRLPSSEAVRAAREFTNRAVQPGGAGTGPGGARGGPGQPSQPGQPTPAAGGFSAYGQGPVAVLGDSGKALKKVEERLDTLDERLEKIEQMLEKLVGKSAPKSK